MRTIASNESTIGSMISTDNGDVSGDFEELKFLVCVEEVVGGVGVLQVPTTANGSLFFPQLVIDRICSAETSSE